MLLLVGCAAALFLMDARADLVEFSFERCESAGSENGSVKGVTLNYERSVRIPAGLDVGTVHPVLHTLVLRLTSPARWSISAVICPSAVRRLSSSDALSCRS